jgi:GDP-L-fucose synthase
MNTNSRILVLGHSGLAGSALCRKLEAGGFRDLRLVSREQCDLTQRGLVRWSFNCWRPEYVFLFAARVGGILANATFPVEFMAENLRIELNMMEAAKESGVKKLLFLGSACAYPKFAPVPIREESLLTGALEPTNECYALAKISGVRLCDAYRHQYGCDFISAMPTNLYGVGDTYNPINSHVVPGMILKMHQAKRDGLPQVTLWGTGNPTRELLFADDLADACLLLMEKYRQAGTINIGAGKEVSMRELASRVALTVGFSGRVLWDRDKPDGTPNRQIDSRRIFELGWRPGTDLDAGLAAAYRDYLDRYETKA